MNYIATDSVTIDGIAESIRNLGEIYCRMIPRLYDRRKVRMWRGRKFVYWG